MKHAIGIDLGTTNSCIAIMEGGQPEIIINPEGGRIVPSVFAISKSNEKLVGQIAKRQAVVNPQNTVFGVKRLIGRKFGSPEVQQDIKILPYAIERAGNGDAAIRIQERLYSPSEISAYILGYLKKSAEAYLGEKISDVVITVPAYFNDGQRQATKDAGKIAGFNVLRIINEPTAAALSYGLDKKKEGKIAVFDLGGGTFDISILDIGDGVFEVKATNGDTHLGGDDFDLGLIKYLTDEFKKDYGIDLTYDKMALQRLKEEAEKAKMELSTSAQTNVNLPFITADATGPKHLNINVTRAKLETLFTDLLDRLEKPCKTALADAGLKAEDIKEVLLVGGMTRMPAVVERVKRIFGKEPNKGVNPDEVVAMGAAIQAAVLSGSLKNVLLLDVTPLSLGIETRGGVMAKLIEKNTTIPTQKKQTFSTVVDNQSSVLIHVLQGERELAHDNRSLGRFELTDIPPAPMGVPKIEVTIDINADGIVNVTAKDLATNKQQAIRIQDAGGLSKHEINTLIREAELHAEEDKRKKALIDAHNQADTIIHSARKLINEQGNKIDPSQKMKMEELITKLENAIKEEDTQQINQLNKALSQTFNQVAQSMRQHKSGKEYREKAA